MLRSKSLDVSELYFYEIEIDKLTFEQNGQFIDYEFLVVHFIYFLINKKDKGNIFKR